MSFYPSCSIVVVHPFLLSRSSYASFLYFEGFSFLAVSTLLLWGRLISQNQIFFFSLSSSILSGLLDVDVFCKWNSKSVTNFTYAFSKISIILLVHVFSSNFLETSMCLRRCASLPNKLQVSFALYYALLDTHYLPKDGPWSSSVSYTVYICHIQWALSSVSTLLFQLFDPTST